MNAAVVAIKQSLGKDPVKREAMGADPAEIAERSADGPTFARLLATWREWLPSFIARTARYGAVGVGMASLFSGLTIFFKEKAGVTEPDLASFLGFIIALPIGYVAHWAITFQRKHGFFEAWQRFAVLNAISFIVAVPGMHVVTHVFDWDYRIGIAMTWVVSPAINYVVLQLWVFSHRRSA
jgi:putative flippase GtrA